jgi:hypothetical protein
LAVCFPALRGKVAYGGGVRRLHFSDEGVRVKADPRYGQAVAERLG